ncbi:MAG: hypothetical protein WA837_07670 [Xanthobacteraceae bacterium]
MKKGCLVALGIFASLVAVAVGYVWLNFYDIHVRYRLTVEVQDGDQIKTGSSVIDVLYFIQPDWIYSGPNTRPTVIGYAPTVDLGPKGLLFLTFVNPTQPSNLLQASNVPVFCAMDYIWCLPFQAYDKRGTVIYTTTFRQRKAELVELLHQSGPRDVPLGVLPELARFRDIQDPKTYVQVPPDDLAAGFGAEVQLKRVVLELTHEPLMPPPAIWPEWLKQKGGTYDGTLKGYHND